MEKPEVVEYYRGEPVRPLYMVPKKGRKAQLQHMKEEFPRLFTKPGLVVLKPTCANPSIVFEAQQDMAKIDAHNAIVRKGMEKILASMRVANSSKSEAKAAAPDQAKAAPEGKAEAIGGYVVNPEDDLGEPSPKYQKI